MYTMNGYKCRGSGKEKDTVLHNIHFSHKIHKSFTYAILIS